MLQLSLQIPAIYEISKFCGVHKRNAENYQSLLDTILLFYQRKNQILYKGPVATQNYALIISRLNEIKKPHQDVVKVIKEPELKNVELSMLLAGLSTRHHESTVHLIPKKSEKQEPQTSNLFSTQHECPLLKSRIHSQSLNLIKVNDMELGETQLPLLQQLEQKALPNN
ncbi:Hypothetical_protein [Hexamita inflata]|uniref:Hypothetical_protein n=1 Tax=Hexamita inflata TaxID=28002 RepID=A0AA86U1C3_9EUKA|nr:Hypothetical protein HINF_LOCUS25875 [Hexamita inflata]